MPTLGDGPAMRVGGADTTGPPGALGGNWEGKKKIVTEICFARFSLYNLAEFDIDLNKLNSYTLS